MCDVYVEGNRGAFHSPRAQLAEKDSDRILRSLRGNEETDVLEFLGL